MVRYRNRWGMIFILPLVLFLALLVAYPLIYNAYLSAIPGQAGEPFEHYKQAFADPSFWDATVRTFLWVAGSVAGQLSLGLLTAVLLNQKVPGIGLFRTLMLLPWVTPIVASATTWQWMMDPEFGILTHALTVLGFLEPGKGWLTDPNTALPATLLVNVWAMFPLASLVILAALQSVSPELIEAAMIDGANRRVAFRHVTLPSIAPTLATLATLLTIWSMNSFTSIKLLTGGGPMRSTEIASLYIYREAFTFFNFGKAAAASFILFSIALLVVMVWARLDARERRETSRA